MKYGKGILFPNFKRAWLKMCDESFYVEPRLIYLIIFALSYYIILFLIVFIILGVLRIIAL